MHEHAKVESWQREEDGSYHSERNGWKLVVTWTPEPVKGGPHGFAWKAEGPAGKKASSAELLEEIEIAMSQAEGAAEGDVVAGRNDDLRRKELQRVPPEEIGHHPHRLVPLLDPEHVAGTREDVGLGAGQRLGEEAGVLRRDELVLGAGEQQDLAGDAPQARLGVVRGDGHHLAVEPGGDHLVGETVLHEGLDGLGFALEVGRREVDAEDLADDGFRALAAAHREAREDVGAWERLTKTAEVRGAEHQRPQA
jgi:hypothetical protein